MNEVTAAVENEYKRAAAEWIQAAAMCRKA
jgi:hypothetical protein